MNKNTRNVFKSADRKLLVSTLGVWPLLIVGLLLSGNRIGRAQKTMAAPVHINNPQVGIVPNGFYENPLVVDNLPRTPVFEPVFDTTDMSADMVMRYVEYLNANHESPCVSAATFLQVYQEIARRATLDSIIEKRVNEFDKKPLRNKFIYSWPGATRNINNTWR